MKKSMLAIAALLSLCVTLIAVGLSADAAPADYTYTLLQDFESADANADAYIWGDGGLLTFAPDTTVKNTGSQSVKVTIGGINTATNQPVNNLYPRITANNFSAFAGVCYWIKTDSGKTVADVGGVKMAGRIEGYVQTNSARYMTSPNVGDIFMMADGSNDMVAMEKAGDGRYWLPADFTGTIFMPFSSMANWTADADLSAVTELALGFHCADFAENVYYVDSVRGYGDGSSPASSNTEPPASSDTEPPASSDAQESNEPELPDGEIDPLMIQNFEKRYTASVISRWEAGAAADFALETGKGVNGSTALKITFGDRNGQQQSFVAFLTLQNTNLNAGKTLMFYAENPQTAEDGQVALGFTFEEKSGERWYVGEGKKYYLVSTDGEAKEQQNGGDGRLVIPAGFKGYVLVPRTSLKLNMGSLVDGDMDLTEVNACLIDADSAVTNGKSVYLDEYRMSEKSASAVVDELTAQKPGESSDDAESSAPVLPESSGESSAETPAESSGAASDGGNGENPDTGAAVPVAALAVLTAAAAVCTVVRKHK